MVTSNLKFLIITILIICVHQICRAENGLFGLKHVSIWTGYTHYSTNVIGEEKSTNFGNYIVGMYGSEMNINLGISARFQLNRSFFTESEIYWTELFRIQNFKILLQYMPRNNYGYSAGYYQHNYYIKGYSDDPKLNVDHYFLLHHCPAIKMIDKGGIVGVFYEGTYKSFTLRGKLSTGLSFSPPFNTNLYYKRVNSNERMEVSYSVNQSVGFIFLPEIEIWFRIFKRKEKTNGLVLLVNTLFASKNFDYKFEQSSWLYDNYTHDGSSNVKPAWFIMPNLSLGLYRKF